MNIDVFEPTQFSIDMTHLPEGLARPHLLKYTPPKQKPYYYCKATNIARSITEYTKIDMGSVMR
jgi:hypothetical protein